MAGEIVAEMVANVLNVVASTGDQLDAGDIVVILESMKMEIPVLTEEAGTVADIRVHKGDVVQEGDILAILT
ncbi:MAG: biotin/lipoyl-binding carrier protein [Nocardioidaceae bacterium]